MDLNRKVHAPKGSERASFGRKASLKGLPKGHCLSAERLPFGVRKGPFRRVRKIPFRNASESRIAFRRARVETSVPVLAWESSIPPTHPYNRIAPKNTVTRKRKGVRNVNFSNKNTTLSVMSFRFPRHVSRIFLTLHILRFYIGMKLVKMLFHSCWICPVLPCTMLALSLICICWKHCRMNCPSRCCIN